MSKRRRQVHSNKKQADVRPATTTETTPVPAKSETASLVAAIDRATAAVSMKDREDRRWHRDVLGLTALALSIVSILISVISTFISWQSSGHANKVAAQSNLYAQTASLSELFLQPENLEFHPYFFGSVNTTTGRKEPVPIPSDKLEQHRFRLELLGEAYTDLFENVLQTSEVLSPEDRRSWEAYIDAVYERSPYMLQFIEQEEASYTTKLVERARAIGRRLEVQKKAVALPNKASVE